jgi:hypothetical protein
MVVAVDCDEDGQFDGWVARQQLSSAFTRPVDRQSRGAARRHPRKHQLSIWG